MQRSGSRYARPVAAVALAASLVAPVVLQANTPYEVIIERNPFGLRPPPPPQPIEDPKPPEPPANIDLTGITTFEGEKRAMFNVKSKDGKSIEPKTFREGERQDQIEVISIDPVKGAVRLRNSGIETVVSFETHGSKIPIGAVPVPTLPGAPLVRPAGIPGIPQPPGMPSGIGEDGNPAAPAIPTRSIRVPPLPQGAPQGSAITVPGNSTVADAGNGSPAAQQSSLTVEQQVLLMEANRIYDEQQRRRGIPVPPLPPTPMTQ